MSIGFLPVHVSTSRRGTTMAVYLLCDTQAAWSQYLAGCSPLYAGCPEESSLHRRWYGTSFHRWVGAQPQQYSPKLQRNDHNCSRRYLFRLILLRMRLTILLQTCLRASRRPRRRCSSQQLDSGHCILRQLHIPYVRKRAILQGRMADFRVQRQGGGLGLTKTRSQRRT